MTWRMGERHDDGAPVVQLLLTLSFQSPLVGIGIIELGEIASLYRDSFPVFSAIKRAMNMGTDPNEISVTIGTTPRISLSSGDARYNIFIQEDRLSYGWNRTSPLDEPHDYPGFNASYATLRRHISRLSDWAAVRGQSLSPAVGEVVYTDAFVLPSDGAVDHIYANLVPPPEYNASSFSSAWTRDWPGSRSGYVQGIIQSPAISPEGVATTTLESTARFWSGGNWDACDAAFEEGHAAITNVFETVVKSSARAKSLG